MTTLPSIRHLQVFVAIARFRSFSRSAQALGITQSALSQSIAQMEFLLDVPLVQRNRRHVTLTAAGQAFLPKALGMLEDLGEAVEEVKRVASPLAGRVVVACMSSTLLRILPDVVEAFGARYPDAILSVREVDATAIAEQILEGEADLALSVMFRNDIALDFLPLIEDELHFVCRRDHRLAGRRSMSWSALEKIDAASIVHWNGLEELVVGNAPLYGKKRSPVYTVTRIPTVFDLIRETGFVSVLPALALSHPFLDESFHHAPMVEPTVRRSVGLITPRDRSLTPTAAAMRDMLLEHVRAMSEQAPRSVRVVYPASRARQVGPGRAQPSIGAKSA